MVKQMYAIMGHVQSETQYPYSHASTCCMRCPAYWKVSLALCDDFYYVVKNIVAKYMDYHYVLYVPEQGDKTYFILLLDFC